MKREWFRPRLIPTSLGLESLNIVSGYPFKELLRLFFGEKGAMKVSANIFRQAKERSNSMTKEAYFMSEASFAESETPYQVQTFAYKDKPPVCQDFGTYDLAVVRICELIKTPTCPMTGAHLIGIVLVKRLEPETLIYTDISAAAEMLKGGSRAADAESYRVPNWLYNRSLKASEFREWLRGKGITDADLIEAGFEFLIPKAKAKEE